MHTVLAIKSKHCKRNVLKLSTEVVVGRCSSRYFVFKMPQYSQENICVGLTF